MQSVQMIVQHPKLGEVTVFAFCRVDALLQAKMALGCEWDKDLDASKVLVRREDLARLRAERARENGALDPSLCSG